MSFAAHGLRGVTAGPEGDIRAQTKQVLQRIDNYLALGGTDKSKFLTAQVWLTDFRLFDDMNAVWNEWVDKKTRPCAPACAPNCGSQAC